jgi:hypothetical protein
MVHANDAPWGAARRTGMGIRHGDGGEAAADRLLSRISAWFQGPGELAALPPEEVERMARDIGFSADQLRDMAAMGPDAARLLHERLSALGLSPADVDRVAFGLIRDLERDCACCGSKEQCEKDLAHQPDSPGWMAYCANAGTIDAIRRTKGRAAI